MADIKIRRTHAMALGKARKEAEKIAAQLEEKFNLSYEWDGNRVIFQRPGVTGFMEVGKNAIVLEAQLGMLLAFLQPTIEGHVNDYLDRVFGAAAKPARGAKNA